VSAVAEVHWSRRGIHMSWFDYLKADGFLRSMDCKSAACMRLPKLASVAKARGLLASPYWGARSSATEPNNQGYPTTTQPAQIKFANLRLA